MVIVVFTKQCASNAFWRLWVARANAIVHVSGTHVMHAFTQSTHNPAQCGGCLETLTERSPGMWIETGTNDAETHASFQTYFAAVFGRSHRFLLFSPLAFRPLCTGHGEMGHHVLQIR